MHATSLNYLMHSVCKRAYFAPGMIKLWAIESTRRADVNGLAAVEAPRRTKHSDAAHTERCDVFAIRARFDYGRKRLRTDEIHDSTASLEPAVLLRLRFLNRDFEAFVRQHRVSALADCSTRRRWSGRGQGECARLSQLVGSARSRGGIPSFNKRLRGGAEC